MLIQPATVVVVMNLFRKAGKKFEETKQTFMDGKESEYVCHSCKEPVDEDYEYCPHCGEDAIELIE